GQFLLQVPGGTEEVLIRDLRGGGIQHQTLVDAGFRVVLNQGQLEVSYDESPLIGSVEPVAADGQIISTVGTTSSNFDGRTSLGFVFAGPPPADMALRITTYSDLQEVAVPFRFEGLPLPEPQEL